MFMVGLKKCGTKDESCNSIIERLLNLYEEFDLEQYIEKQYQKLKEDKEKFIPLEQYEAQRRWASRFRYNYITVVHFLDC